jgi:hypothetical protein
LPSPILPRPGSYVLVSAFALVLRLSALPPDSPVAFSVRVVAPSAANRHK